MSAAAVWLLVLVGGSSLVSYAVIARHLTPAVTLARPHIMGVSSSPASSTGPSGPAAQSRPGSRADQGAVAKVASGPLATALKVAVMLTPAPPSPSSPTPVGTAAQPSATATPEPDPSTTPEPEPSPTEAEPTPAASPAPTPTPTESPPSLPVIEVLAPSN
jgi:hypothetical protein